MPQPPDAYCTDCKAPRRLETNLGAGSYPSIFIEHQDPVTGKHCAQSGQPPEYRIETATSIHREPMTESISEMLSRLPDDPHTSRIGSEEMRRVLGVGIGSQHPRRRGLDTRGNRRGTRDRHPG